MKKHIIVLISTFILLTACSPSSKEITSSKKQETSQNTPTVETRDEFLKANEFITDFQSTKEPDSNTDKLTITLNDEFLQKDISEQYLYLVDFYEEFNVKYGELYDLLGSIDVYFNNNDFPTYIVYKRTFSIVAANVGIDREIGQRPSQNILDLLDTLDKTQVMSGTYKGLTLAEKDAGTEPKVKETLITTSEEIKGALNSGNAVTSNNKSIGSNDAETYIEGMDGNDWVKLTDNQKFHGVSNALYGLDQNGYTIDENENYYIDALDSFYTDPSTMSVPVNEALAQVGIISNTIRK